MIEQKTLPDIDLHTKEPQADAQAAWNDWAYAKVEKAMQGKRIAHSNVTQMLKQALAN